MEHNFHGKKKAEARQFSDRNLCPKMENADPGGAQNQVLPGIIGKIFHPGWKTTFLFSALATASVYFTYIADSEFSDRYSLAVVVFLAIYALIAKLMFNLRPPKRGKD